jgi:hypothetical protein
MGNFSDNDKNRSYVLELSGYEIVSTLAAIKTFMRESNLEEQSRDGNKLAIEVIANLNRVNRELFGAFHITSEMERPINQQTDESSE